MRLRMVLISPIIAEGQLKPGANFINLDQKRKLRNNTAYLPLSSWVSH